MSAISRAVLQIAELAAQCEAAREGAEAARAEAGALRDAAAEAEARGAGAERRAGVAEAHNQSLEEALAALHAELAQLRGGLGECEAARAELARRNLALEETLDQQMRALDRLQVGGRMPPRPARLRFLCVCAFVCLLTRVL